MLVNQYILKRERIIKELNNIFNYPLTIAVAAMGYGKTIAARDFLNDVNTSYIWLTIENDENSPQYLWDILTRQLIRKKPKLGDKLNALGFPIDAPQRDRVINIIEDYFSATNTVLVIDDYHFAHSAELDSLIERIVRLNIKGLHILILSRTKPEINIDELILKGYCYLLKGDMFEVTKHEIKEYFKLYGYNISNDTVRQIYKISEGWISAVYLIMQRYGKIGKLESLEDIERLIEKAVISQYNDREKRIMISLSILDSFTPKQSVYVSGDVLTSKFIRKLSNINSFIRYDEQNGVYRIHNILKNYLRKLFSEKFTDTEGADFYKRSGEWLVKNGDVILGIKYLFKAKEYDSILTEFEKDGIIRIIDKNPQYIVKLFKQIPDKIKYRHPIGYIFYAGFYVINVDMKTGEYLLTKLEEYYKNDDLISPDMKRRILGEIELSRSFIEFNDPYKMHLRQLNSYRLLKGSSIIANKNMIVTFGSPHILYLFYKGKGKMLSIVEYFENKFYYFREVSGGCGTGFEYQMKSEYYLETCDFDNAELYAYKAIYKTKVMEQISIIICSKLTLARACLAKGKFDKAMLIIDNLKIEVQKCNSHILSSSLDLCAGYIYGIIGKQKSIAKWLRAGDIFYS